MEVFHFGTLNCDRHFENLDCLVDAPGVQMLRTFSHQVRQLLR